jgi:EmrB/QacA subfamily drug resistance transporter
VGERLTLAAQIGLLAGPFLSMVDSNIVNVALPAISKELHTPLATVQWITSGYLLATAAVLPASAFIAKRFGTRRVYLASLAGFTLASVLCALAPDINLLIAARVLQGALGAPMVPLAMGMLLGEGGAADNIPPAAGMLLFLAPAIGPTIGGLLIDWAGWPSIFLINLPVGMAGALGVIRTPGLARDGSRSEVRFDPIGLVLLTAGFTLGVYGTTQGPQSGWFSADAWPYWLSGACLLVAYVAWALRRRNPAVDLKLLRQPQTALAIGISSLASIVLFSMLFLLPVYIQNLQGFSPLTAGLALIPQGITTGLGTVLGTSLSKRWNVRGSTVLGMGILAASTASLLALRLDTSPWLTAALLATRGLALGLVIQPLLMSTIGRLKADEAPDGNTLFNVVERLSGSVGIALLATFFQTHVTMHVADALHQLGQSAASMSQAAAGSSSGSFAALPPPARAMLGNAALAGFHDTIWLLVGLSLVGLSLTLLLERNRSEAEG